MYHFLNNDVNAATVTGRSKYVLELFGSNERKLGDWCAPIELALHSINYSLLLLDLKLCNEIFWGFTEFVNHTDFAQYPYEPLGGIIS